MYMFIQKSLKNLISYLYYDKITLSDTSEILSKKNVIEHFKYSDDFTGINQIASLNS